VNRATAADPAALRPAHSPRDRRIAESGALMVMVVWAANFIVVKAANHQIPPIAFAFIRFSLAATVLLVILRVREGDIAMPRRDLARVLGLGAIGFGLYQVLWPTALQTIAAGDSALLIAATPVLTVLLAGVAGSDTLTRAKLAGGLVSFTGDAIVIATGPGLSLAGSIPGDVLTLAAALCWATYTAFGASVLRRYSPLRTTAWAMVGGSVVLAGPGLFQASGADWGAVSGAAWAGLAYSAILAAGVANVVVFHAIKLVGPTPVTALQSFVPFLAVLMGAAFLSEAIRPEQIVGGVVIILGVFVTRMGAHGMARIRDLLPLE